MKDQDGSLTVIHFDIHINKYQPIAASSYIPLPGKLVLKKAIFNVKNSKNNECFKWSVTESVYPRGQHKELINKK